MESLQSPSVESPPCLCQVPIQSMYSHCRVSVESLEVSLRSSSKVNVSGVFTETYAGPHAAPSREHLRTTMTTQAKTQRTVKYCESGMTI